MVPIYVVAIAIASLTGPAIQRLSLPAFAVFLVFPLTLLPVLPIVLWAGRARRLAIRHKGRVCGNCLFPLEGLSTLGDCPECGRGYSIKHTIACWKRDLGLNGKYEFRHWPELPKDDTP